MFLEKFFGGAKLREAKAAEALVHAHYPQYHDLAKDMGADGFSMVKTGSVGADSTDFDIVLTNEEGSIKRVNKMRVYHIGALFKKPKVS